MKAKKNKMPGHLPSPPLFAKALFSLVAGLVLSVGFPAQAAKIGGLSKAELLSVRPLLERYGTVTLSETDAKGQPRAMTSAIRVAASRELIFKALENPENFYYISTLFKENNVLQSHDNSRAWSWASRHKLFSFTGVNTMALYPPRRVDVHVTKSNIGSGDFRLQMYADGEKHTILVVSGLLDVDSSEWLIRFLVGRSPVMRQAMNVAIGIVMIKGIKTMAERMAAGKPLDPHRTKGKRGAAPTKPLSKADIGALRPVLQRGMVVLTRSVPGGRMDQVTALKKLKAKKGKVLAAVASPQLYPKMLSAISELEIHERDKQKVEFSWNFGLSVFGLGSRNLMTFTPTGVRVQALSGELKDAEWSWQLAEDGADSTILAYHGWADLGRSAPILKTSIKREPYLEHGFMAGSNMVMLSAIRRAVESE